MTRSRMEMFYFGPRDNALKTGLGAIMETNAATWRAFNNARSLAVSKERATFFLDYYNARGDLSDSIMLDDDGFEQITGERVQSAEHYARVDEDFWKGVLGEENKR